MDSKEANDLARLPEGWFVSDSEQAGNLHAELKKELPPGHLLFGKDVKVVAHRDGTDDILCRHVGEPGRYTVVHLTWVMKQEINAQFPFVEVDGDFEAFLEYERAYLGR